ncbi:hypothetical protein EJ04DRAFT_549748 [Polyplosphaeria fusca]|uniref:Uncharacterized protein n=1 Tax=Polyplosphaeria fusca TaxID=682080 RepID=A0A9P4R8Q8_9PLEO|nr:hypothetical protein EJ04DRAFT_549748 [Polyplosphaeria fusca]
MAGLGIPATTSRLVLLARHELQTLARPSKMRSSLLQSSSRATCSWAANHALWRPVLSNQSASFRIGGTAPFCRSAVLKAGQDHKKKEGPKASGKANQGPVDVSSRTGPAKPIVAPSTISSTIKSKLPSLRHENIYTLPNILTFSRLIATPVIGYLIVQHHHLYAFSLFAYAGFSDLLDGWIARKWKLQTVVGSVVDPMADKALMTTVVTTLAYSGALPLPLATLILGRDVSLAIAAIYYRYASLPAPKTFARYWDFSLPSAEVHPTTMSKLNTFLQLLLIGVTMGVGLLHDPAAVNSAAGGWLRGLQEGMGGEDGVRSVATGMQVVVAGTTVWSGLSYAWLKSAVKILGEDEVLKRKQGFRGRMIVGGCFGSVILLAVGLAGRDFLRAEEEAIRDNKQ